jgi:cytoskeleton protein RodZ
MSLSLGEKLRQAREERGISISEVAEQTRISPLYLKSIEKDDYKPLPGGIFNKGFVRSYARYIGYDEEEALQEYAQLVAEDEALAQADHGVHRPEVLTDDSMSQSMAPTILVAVVILAVLGGGLYLLVRYLSSPGRQTANSNVVANANNNANSAAADNNAPSNTSAAAAFSIELKAISEPVWVRYSTEEGARERTLSPNETLGVDVSDTFRLTYARVKASNLQLSINGRRINVPADGAKGNVDIEINRSNVAQVIESGEIGGQPAALPTPRPEITRRPTPKPVATPAVRPSLPPINTAPKRPPQ